MGFNYFLIFLKRKIFRKRYLVILVFLAGFYFYGQIFRVPDGKLHVRFLDVGQGDATLITTPKGSNVLVDGGPNDKVLGLVNQFIPPSDRRIDLLLLTHPHADHVTGLISILANYQVGNIAFDPVSYESATYTRFLKAVEDEKTQGAKVINPKTGDKINVGDLSLTILWAPQEGLTLKGLDPNNESIISVLSYGDFDVFLPGDAQKDEADALVSSGAIINPVEVLKAAHHGSVNGLSASLEKALAPALTVIPVGKNNSFGHPSIEVLNLLNRLGSKVLRTDLNGTIEIVSDGKSWGVR